MIVLDKKQKSNVLNILGLAYRAQKVTTGDKEVLRAIKQNRAKLVFVASDASEKTFDRFDKKCYFYNIKMNTEYTTDELSNAIGKPLCKIIAITDEGFQEALIKNFNGGVK